MLRLLLLVVVCSGLAVRAQADLFLDLRFTDNTTSKTVASGDTVFVDLILSDPSDDDGLSLEGLISGGGLVFQSAGAATVTSVGSVQGPEFIAPVFQPIPPGAGVIDSVVVTPPLFPFPIPAGFGLTSITLATFQMVVTGNAGDTAILRADVIDPTHVSGSNILFTSNTDLDALLTDLATTPGNFGGVTLSIAAVPEPETMLLFGLLVVAGIVVYHRRQQARLSVVSPDGQP